MISEEMMICLTPPLHEVTVYEDIMPEEHGK